jgi:excisionase family DNA binding protein
VREVAARLNLWEKTVRKRIANGELPATRLGESPKAPIRVAAGALDQWLNNRDALTRLRIRARLAVPLARSRRDRLAALVAPKPPRVRVKRRATPTIERQEKSA